MTKHQAENKYAHFRGYCAVYWDLMPIDPRVPTFEWEKVRKMCEKRDINYYARVLQSVKSNDLSWPGTFPEFWKAWIDWCVETNDFTSNANG